MAKYKGSYLFHTSTWFNALLRVLSVGNVAELKSVTKFELLWYKKKGPVGGITMGTEQNPRRVIRRALADELFRTTAFLQKESDVIKRIFEEGING